LFVSVVGVYPVGSMLRLSNGATAVVVSLPSDPGSADRPVVKIVRAGDGTAADTLFDLSAAAGVHVLGSVPVDEMHENPLHFLLA